jgi:hypothetical protein
MPSTKPPNKPTGKRKRTYKVPPIAPGAVYITRQQAADAYGGGSVQLIDKLTKDNPQIQRLRVPGRGETRPAWRVLICRADLDRYLQQYVVQP